jgi:hypothetical protein
MRHMGREIRKWRSHERPCLGDICVWEADFCVGQRERRDRQQSVSAGRGAALRAAT